MLLVLIVADFSLSSFSRGKHRLYLSEARTTAAPTRSLGQEWREGVPSLPDSFQLYYAHRFANWSEGNFLYHSLHTGLLCFKFPILDLTPFIAMFHSTIPASIYCVLNLLFHRVAQFLWKSRLKIDDSGHQFASSMPPPSLIHSTSQPLIPCYAVLNFENCP